MTEASRMTDEVQPMAPIVVGVDGSPEAQDALKWAANEASSMHRPLCIVHGFIWPLMGVALGPPAGGPSEAGFQAEAERVLADAEQHARSTAPHIEVTSQLVTGAPTQVLLDQARDAELVVLGHRGLGGFVGLLVGSVGVEVAAHAPCPVVIVQPRGADSPRPLTGRVVVGVDGSDLSTVAISFAFQAAMRRGAGVTAVHAWDAPGSVDPSLTTAVDKIEEVERRLLVESLQAERQRYPDVDVQSKLVNAHPGHALVAESAEAELVVVGSRGRGGFKGMLLGSVSQAVVQHADCPVAVVRAHG